MSTILCDICHRPLGHRHGLQRYHKGVCRAKATAAILKRHMARYKAIGKWRRDGIIHGGADYPQMECRVPGWKSIPGLWLV